MRNEDTLYPPPRTLPTVARMYPVGRALPAVARAWPAVRRDALVASWALVVDDASTDGPCAPRPTTPEAIEAVAAALAVSNDFDSILAAAAPWIRGATAFPSYRRREVDPRTMKWIRYEAAIQGEAWALALVEALARDAAPIAPDIDASTLERATWEALDGLRLPSLSSLDRWPCEVEDHPDSPEVDPETLAPEARAPRGRDASPNFTLSYYAERLPPVEAARVWLATLRARMNEASLSLAILRASPPVRALAVRRALEAAAQLFPGDIPGRLAGDPRAVEALDIALSTGLVALHSKAGDDAAGALVAALRRTGAQGRADASEIVKRPPDLDAWRDPRRVAARLALALWCDQVAPRLLQRPPTLRYPATIASAFGSLRGEGASRIQAPSAEQSTAIIEQRRTDRSFAIPVIGAAPMRGDYFYVVPPKGSPLLLPLDGQPRGSAAWREVIRGGVLRAHVLSWDLWEQQGCDPSGKFQWTPHDAARALGRTSRSRGADMTADFEKLTTILIAGVDTGRGKIEALTPEPLIQRYTREDGERVYRHAPMTVDVVRGGGGSFLQVPRALVEVDPRHLPLGLGIAAVVRDGVVLAAKGDGTIRHTLRALLERAGEDASAGARKNGRAYWEQAAARLKKLAAQGDLAAFDVEGEGPDAVVILVPSNTLRDAYRPLTARALPSAAGAKRLPGRRRGKGTP